MTRAKVSRCPSALHSCKARSTSSTHCQVFPSAVAMGIGTKMDGSAEYPRSWRTGEQSHQRRGGSFYASFLQRMFDRKLAAQLNHAQAADVTAVSSSTEDLPTLKVQTLNSDQQGVLLPPIAQRGLPAVKHHHRHHATPEKMKRCQPPPSQKAVHPVQLQMDCVGGSQSIGCSAWDDYDFTPVYIWVPKRQRQQSKTAQQESEDPKVKTTYLNETIVLPGSAGGKKKKRRKPPTRSPSARWYGDLLSEYYSDLIDLTDEQWSEILAGTGLRDIIGSRASHSRAEHGKKVSDSRVASKMAMTPDEPSAAPVPQAEDEEEKEAEGSQCVKDNTPLKAPESSEAVTTAGGPSQGREATDHSKEGGLMEEPSPPKENSPEAGTEEDQTEMDESALKSWPRPPEHISRYPYGNPTKPRMPRTQSVPVYPLSLQSTASHSTTKMLRAAHNVSMQSTEMIQVRTCELSPRTSKEHGLPPIISCTRTPPPTTSKTIKLSNTNL